MDPHLTVDDNMKYMSLKSYPSISTTDVAFKSVEKALQFVTWNFVSFTVPKTLKYKSQVHIEVS